MEIWYDKETKEVKATYAPPIEGDENSSRYSGTAWSDAGYLVYRSKGALPNDITRGATLDFDLEGKPVVVAPAPIPVPVPSRLDLLKAEYAAAPTDADRLDILARAAGLV